MAYCAGYCTRGQQKHYPPYLAKVGHADLRKVLFMPALATYGRKKAFVAFVERLKANGKAPKEIVIALMRKIITIAQAVLKSQTPFNAELHAS